MSDTRSKAPLLADVLSGASRWCVVHGDALDELESMDFQVGCVVTDPPYSSGARTEAAKASRGDGMLRGPRWATRARACGYRVEEHRT